MFEAEENIFFNQRTFRQIKDNFRIGLLGKAIPQIDMFLQ